MKKLLSVLVLLCTASYANVGLFPQPGIGIQPGFPQPGFPQGPQHELMYLSNNLVRATNQLLDSARRVVGFQVGIPQRQALGRLEDLNRTAFQYNHAVQRLLQGGFDSHGGIYQLRQLQQILEQATYHARQSLPDLFCNGFLGGPQVQPGFPGQGIGFPGQYPGHFPGQFPAQPFPGGFVDPQLRFHIEGLMRQVDDIVRELRVRV